MKNISKLLLVIMLLSFSSAFAVEDETMEKSDTHMQEDKTMEKSDTHMQEDKTMEKSDTHMQEDKPGIKVKMEMHHKMEVNNNKENTD